MSTFSIQKYNNFLRIGWFLAKIFLILGKYPRSGQKNNFTLLFETLGISTKEALINVHLSFLGSLQFQDVKQLKQPVRLLSYLQA